MVASRHGVRRFVESLLTCAFSVSIALLSVSGCNKDAANTDEAGRVMRPITSPQFSEPIGRIPLPAKWEFNSQPAAGAPTVVGPDGIKIYDQPFKAFSYSRNARMRRFYRKSGQPMRKFPSMKKVIDKDFVPEAKKRGLRLVRTFDVPALAKYDENYNGQLYQAMPSKQTFHAVGTEWEDQNGSPSLVVIRLTVGEGQGFQTWSYYAHILEASRSAYEKAKDDLMYALLNTEHNRAFIASYNQKEEQKAKASWSRHNRRMKAQQRNFEAQQRAITESNNAVNDAIMGSWRNRNAAQDRGHSKTIDGIREEQNMRDPSTGKSYKVESGANQYWKNNQGEYIKSDDRFYNPNRDSNTNHQEWNELEPE